MFISDKELLFLYILQKNFKELNSFDSKKLFEEAYNSYFSAFEISIEEKLAPSMFPGQPPIPFTLFKPISASAKSPKPLVVHTHGGPNVYFGKDNKLAEFLPLLININCVIACPNYRGSSDHPHPEERENWLSWKEKANFRVHGPEDVYAVTAYLCQQDFIQEDKVLLRGGSHGSFINSHLLVRITQEGWKNYFTGLHLSGGSHYPPSSLIADIPLFISHGLNDPINMFALVQLFFENSLLNYAAKIRSSPVQTFVARYGAHHIIDPDLQLDDEDHPAFNELKSYINLTTAFSEAVLLKKTYTPETIAQQYASVTLIHDLEEIEKRIKLYTEVQQSPPILPLTSLESSDYANTKQSINGPSLALLKIHLGQEFTGIIAHDVRRFLKKFMPYDLNKREVDNKIRKEMLADNNFVQQLITMVEVENKFLCQNRDSIVLYHGAQSNVLRYYTLINIWIYKLQSLQGSLQLKRMRFFEFMQKSFRDIHFFIKQMRTQPYHDVFNNRQGFAERAISCNPSPFSNSFCTFFSSLMWYFDSKENERLPLKEFSTFLNILGINRNERWERYMDLFKEDEEAGPQGLMQQFFLPQEIAQRKVYLCQGWGEPFLNPELMDPLLLFSLISDPENFEKTLKGTKQDFSKLSALTYSIPSTFSYADTIQARFLLTDKMEVKSYVRNPNQHRRFFIKLKPWLTKILRLF